MRRWLLWVWGIEFADEANAKFRSKVGGSRGEEGLRGLDQFPEESPARPASADEAVGREVGCGFGELKLVMGWN